MYTLKLNKINKVILLPSFSFMTFVGATSCSKHMASVKSWRGADKQRDVAIIPYSLEPSYSAIGDRFDKELELREVRMAANQLKKYIDEFKKVCGDSKKEVADIVGQSSVPVPFKKAYIQAVAKYIEAMEGAVTLSLHTVKNLFEELLEGVDKEAISKAAGKRALKAFGAQWEEQKKEVKLSLQHLGILELMNFEKVKSLSMKQRASEWMEQLQDIEIQMNNDKWVGGDHLFNLIKKYFHFSNEDKKELERYFSFFGSKTGFRDDRDKKSQSFKAQWENVYKQIIANTTLVGSSKESTEVRIKSSSDGYGYSKVTFMVIPAGGERMWGDQHKIGACFRTARLIQDVLANHGLGCVKISNSEGGFQLQVTTSFQGDTSRLAEEVKAKLLKEGK